MATLVLQTVGSVVGGVVGGPMGAILGRALGGIAGAALDTALLGGGDGTRHVEGPRLKDVDGLTSTEGAAIPRVYGRARLGGQLIWATRLEEVVTTDTRRAGTSGGKGFGGGGQKTVTTTYSYFANVAVGLCEGPISFVRRVWADGREIDFTTVTMRVHRGEETQAPDPLIVAKEGVENAPAYRGLAYVVFERLPLADYGNRVPQFSFEVVRAVEGLPEMIRAVCLIPGAGEFAYDPQGVMQLADFGRAQSENRHQLQRESDVIASLDALQALCPNLERVSLVVTWFGDDLRAGTCTITPRVESNGKPSTEPWSVAGLDRASALPVSLVDGRPAYGGTPSDASVLRVIAELKARGLSVVLYPFVMMDVPGGNGLPNPHGAGEQAAYPWRGRITCMPAPDRPGTPDGTAAAGAEVQAFFHNPWGLRRLVLHYAALAQQAGGVEAVVIGSELVGLTRVRSGAGVYPATAELMQLATDALAIVGGGTRITYAADWTEYGAHVRDGGAEVRFPLDPLWAHADIDAVGIDYYPPISDWRDGGAHADLGVGRSAHDADYLRGRLGAGEAFDWFYASAAHRRAQTRTPITDGAYNKPWIYRVKDLVSWWGEPHVERAGGVEIGATPWVPRAKAIWLTEIGIPAVDKGANGPNVFPDPKSSESAYPPFSNGARDDLVQARGLEAILMRFDPALPGFESSANPVSAAGLRMVDPAHTFVWAWDARPFPAFPDCATVWADSANWETGHWINGRLEGVPLDRLVRAVLSDYGVEAGAVPLDGFVDGYVIDRPLSARGALEPLGRLFGFDPIATAEGLRWRGRGSRVVTALAADDLVMAEREPGLRLVRAQETELPHQVELGFTDAENEYRRAAVGSRRLAGTSRREARTDVAVVTRRAEAQRLADVWLQDLWAARETAEFALSPRRIEVEPGDVVSLPVEGFPRLHRVVRIADGPVRRVTTRAVEPALFAAPGATGTRPPRQPPPVTGQPFVVVLDLPAAFGEPAGLQYVAAAADPWPGAVTLWRGDGTSFEPYRTLALPALIARTLNALPPGPLWRWDRAAHLDVTLSSGAIPAITDEAVLAGGNLFALQGPDGRWEILSAAGSALIGERTYRLTRLLRGLAGSEPEAVRTVPAGALLVRLDSAVLPLTASLADLGQTWRYRAAPAGRDHADASGVEFTATAGPDALRPLSPVRVSARREAAGIVLRWIRRTRLDGDPWEPIEVPLGEGAERYEVDILQGASVVRTLTSTEPAALYDNAAELADFGAPQAALSVRVAQVSTVVGRGFARSATLAV